MQTIKLGDIAIEAKESNKGDITVIRAKEGKVDPRLLPSII